VQSNLRWTDTAGQIQHTLDAGIRLHSDRVFRVHTENGHDMKGGEPVRNDSDTLTNLDSLSTANALAVHVHEDVRWKMFHLLPGARLEVIQTERVDVDVEPLDPVTRTIVLPGLGSMIDILPSWSVFAGSYRGFSPVPPGEPEEVVPELSWNHEAGSRVSHADFQFEVVAFSSEYTNITGQCTLSSGCSDDDLGEQFSGGAARVWGVESSARQTWLLPGAFSLPMQAAYTFTQGQFRTAFNSSFPQFGDVTAGDYLPYVPIHQVYGRLTVAHTYFDMGVGVSYRSEMLDSAGQFGETDFDIPELLLVDGGLRVMPVERVTIYATGTNLMGNTAMTSWRPMGARPTAPRQVMVGVEVRNKR
jgi:Fe(3+) dicitrate transport protein